MILFNVVLAVVTMSQYFSVAGGLNARTGEEDYTGLAILFVGSYPQAARTGWTAVVALVLVASALGGPLFALMQHFYAERWRGVHRREEVEANQDEIQENLKFTYTQRRLRKTGSLLVFCCIILGQGVVIYFLHDALSKQTDQMCVSCGGASPQRCRDHCAEQHAAERRVEARESPAHALRGAPHAHAVHGVGSCQTLCAQGLQHHVRVPDQAAHGTGA